ncbi:MAG TPA: zf-HC2 domain-containing protein [Mycobacteriales bacterium]
MSSNTWWRWPHLGAPGNHRGPGADWYDVDCTQYRKELSARMDGEALHVFPEALDAHVATCPGCASWLHRAEQVTRLARLAPAAPLRDRTEEILANVPAVRPRGRTLGLVVRLLLAAVALAQAALAYPDLVFGHDAMSSSTHVAHETGAWNAALAVAFLWVALRPRNAGGLLPMVAAFVAMVLAVSLSDLASERVHLERASSHLLAAVGLVLLAVLARRGGRSNRPLLGGRDVVPEHSGMARSDTDSTGPDPYWGADWGGEDTQPASGAMFRGNVA